MKTRIKVTNDKKALWLHFGEQEFVDFLAGKTLLADVVTTEVTVSTDRTSTRHEWQRRQISSGQSLSFRPAPYAARSMTRDGTACHKPLQGIARHLDYGNGEVTLVTPWLAPHLFEILPTTKVFRRGNLRVELDLDEVYPDDPGAGAPAMVYWTSKFVGKIGEYSATYPYAIGEGELDSCLETRRLTDKQCEWLDSLGDKIDEFLG